MEWISFYIEPDKKYSVFSAKFSLFKFKVRRETIYVSVVKLLWFSPKRIFFEWKKSTRFEYTYHNPTNHNSFAGSKYIVQVVSQKNPQKNVPISTHFHLVICLSPLTARLLSHSVNIFIGSVLFWSFEKQWKNNWQ